MLAVKVNRFRIGFSPPEMSEDAPIIIIGLLRITPYGWQSMSDLRYQSLPRRALVCNIFSFFFHNARSSLPSL